MDDLEIATKAQQKARNPNAPTIFPDDDGYDLLRSAITAYLADGFDLLGQHGAFS